MSKIGGKGLFLKEIEEALLEDRIDMAVHSMKDVPHTLQEGLIIAAILPRCDVRDALITKKDQKFAELPIGAIVGTCSSRRKAQLLSKRADLNVVELRGNIQTRLKKLEEQKNLDAIVLAAAGLKRLNLQARITEYFEIDEMLPAGGQGAIGVQIKKGNAKLKDALSSINDDESWYCVQCEREFLKAFGGSCTTPIAAYSELAGDKIMLKASYYSEDGKIILYSANEEALEEAANVGKKTAIELLERKHGITHLESA